MTTDHSLKSGSAIYLVAVPVFAVLCVLCLLWLQHRQKIAARVTECKSENGEAIVTVHCTNRSERTVVIGFDVELTYGIRDSEDQQTIWVPKVHHVDGVSIDAKSEKDEVVRIPSAVQYHVTEVVILNLVISKEPNQALQHNDPSCHVSCLRTPRASWGRG